MTTTTEKTSITEKIFGTPNPADIIPGFLLATALTIAGIFISKGIGLAMGLAKSPVSVVMVAIILGILVKNVIGLSDTFNGGIAFCLKKILRLGIILMGIRLSILAVLKIGGLSVGIVVICISAGIAVTLLVTGRLRISRRLGLLIGIGTGICGATAIVATAPVIDAEDEETAYAVGTITIFGIAVMFIYPYLTGYLMGFNHIQSGLFLGTAIHETAQVAGAGLMYDQLWVDASLKGITTGADAAIITKLVRNIFIAAAIPLVALLYHRKNESGDDKKISIIKLFPVFVLGFIFMSIVRSIGDYLIVQQKVLWDPAAWKSLYSAVKTSAGFLLAVAMAGVGLGTDIRKLKNLGIKPFIAGLFAALSVGGVSILLIIIFHSYFQ